MYICRYAWKSLLEEQMAGIRIHQRIITKKFTNVTAGVSLEEFWGIYDRNWQVPQNDKADLYCFAMSTIWWWSSYPVLVKEYESV